MRHHGGGLVDLLPFSSTIAPGGHLDLGRDLVLNMAGFDHLIPAAVHVPINRELRLPLAPIPLYVWLKLVAFSDRKAPKDLAGVLHCLEHYREDDDIRYALDHGTEPVPFEYTSAYLVGLDGRPFLDARVTASVRPVLDRFDGPDATVVAIVAREKGALLLRDADRVEIFERFHWFRAASAV